jgi:hypothetical protein
MDLSIPLGDNSDSEIYYDALDVFDPPSLGACERYVYAPFRKGTDFLGKSAKVIYNLCSSKLGELTLGAIKENVIEYVGYTVPGFIVGSPARNISRMLGSNFEAVLIAGSGALAAKKAVNSSFFKSKLPNLNFNQNIQKMTQIGVFLAILGAFHEMQNSNIVKPLNEETREELGELVASVSAGLISAFLGIKYAGSDEVFFGNNPIKTYPVKSLISMVGVIGINSMIPQHKNEYTQFITDLFFGSVIYNFQSIFEGFVNLKKGHFLNKSLPREVSLLKMFDEETVAVKSRTFLTSGAFSIVRSFEKNSVNQKLFPLVLDLMNFYLSAMKNEPLFFITSVIEEEKINQMLFSTIVRGVNSYFLALKKYPEIFLILENALNFVDLKNDVLKKVEIFESLKQDFPNLSNLDPDSFFNLIKDLFDLKKSFFDEKTTTIPFINRENKNKIIECLVDFIASQEKDFCGFVLSGPEEKEKIEDFIGGHLDNLMNCILLNSLFVNSLKDHELREFYSNVFGVLPYYYQSLVGKRIIDLVSKVLIHQARHVEF